MPAMSHMDLTTSLSTVAAPEPNISSRASTKRSGLSIMFSFVQRVPFVQIVEHNVRDIFT